MTTHQKLTPPKPATHVTPGWKTTEFWANALVIVGVATAAVSSNLNGHVAAYAATASAAAYAISRGIAKAFPPKS